MDERNGWGLDPQAYVRRVPERLVLEGYRGWTWSTARGSKADWDRACLLYRKDLGIQAEAVIEALDGFASTLGLCAACPLRMRCSGASTLCRDEALVLGLVAAIQHGDDGAIDRSLSALCRPAVADRAALAAGIYALLMRSLGRLLLPVPAGVIAGIDRRSKEAGTRVPAGVTLH